VAVVAGGVAHRRDGVLDVHHGVELLVGGVMLAAGMVVLALVTFAAMLGFVVLCDRV
jgi:hypothetical protein